MEARQEPGERERCLGQRKRTLRALESIQLGIGAHALLDPEINRAHDQFRALGQLSEDLDGGLAVQVGSEVQHLAAMLDAVRGRISPAACQVKADGTARPHNLVLHDVPMRAGGREPGFADDHLPQAREGPGLELLPAWLTAMPQHGGTEHLVVD